MALNNSNLNSPNNNSGSGGGGGGGTVNNNNSATDVGTTNATNGPNENLVVRVDETESLDSLFDSVLKPNESKRPLQVPLSMRKLPSSFFNPPSTGSKSPSVSHSRENSADSAFGSPLGGMNPVTSRLQISHSRAHSSPASLQQTYAALSKQQQQNNNPAVAAAAAAAAAAVAAANNGTDTPGSVVASVAGAQQIVVQAQQQIPNHIKQRSYDVVSAIQLREEMGDLPPGWEQARTAEGQIYYLK